METRWCTYYSMGYQVQLRLAERTQVSGFFCITPPLFHMCPPRASVIYCCIANYLKTCTTSLDYLTVSMGQKFGDALAEQFRRSFCHEVVVCSQLGLQVTG